MTEQHSDSTEFDSNSQKQRRRMTPGRALAASADGFMALDSDRRITLFNRALSRLVGTSQQDAIGRHCFELLRVIDSNGVSLCDSGCPLTRGEDGTFDIEGLLATSDGHTLAVDLNFSVSCDTDGTLKTAVVNVRDAGNLRQVDHIRSVLLASISHELQTPIAIIKAYASTLSRDDAHWSPETIREKLKSIEEESDRLSALVGRLLLTSRLEAGAVSLNLMLVDLPNETRRVCKRLAELDETHEIVSSFPADFPAVMGDPEKLDTVLTNLIENALKFSPDGGTVAIEGSSSDEEVFITVSDHGVGIDTFDQERLFERFYRSGEPGQAIAPGTGLGLYICRSLVHAHGGHIWVDSKPGEGSRFTFSLPRTSDEAA
ncbi:MAG: PAS domain S-box protein [Dehalococcoidia bacterium]|nr:PAS domain S-box protein [Dehalococcoidia bacterium]